MLNKQPKNWGDITVNQFIELSKLKVDDFDNEDELNLYYLSLLTDTSTDIIEELPFNKFEELLNQFKFVNKFPNKPPSQTIQTPAGPLYFIQEFNHLEIGAFIDLEHFITNDYISNLKVILSIFYRQKIKDKDLLYNQKFEEYGDWIYHRADLFDNVSILEVYKVIPNYLNWREKFFENYDGLLSGPIDEDDDESFDNGSVISKSEMLKEKQKEKTIKKWSWNLFLYQLANNNILQMSEASKLNVIEAFNILSMKRELGL
jgi:hypothetical protein